MCSGSGSARPVRPSAERPGAAHSRLAGNAAALLAARLVSFGVALVASPFLFATLGARAFGLWVLLVGLLAVAGLADLGLGSAAVREVAQGRALGRPGRAQAALALALGANLGLGLLLLLAVAVAWPELAAAFHLGGLAGEGRDAAFLLVASFLADAASAPSRAVLEGCQRMRPVALASALNALVAGALGVALVAAGFGVAGLGVGVLAASMLRSGFLFAVAARSAPRLRPSFSALTRTEVRGLLGYGVRVQTTNAASAVNVDADRLVLGAVFSPAVVAPFDLGAKLAGAMRVLPSFFLVALFPLAATHHAEGERALLDRMYLRATRYLALFASLFTAALVVSAGYLVELWIGRPLPLAATTLALLAPAWAVTLVSGPAATVTRAEGSPGRETRAALVSAGLNVVLTVPLLLVFGAIGAPLASAVAWTLGTAYFVWHFHRASGRPLAPLFAVVWKPFAAGTLGVVLASAAAARFGGDPSGRLEAALAVAGHTGLATLVVLLALLALRFFDVDDRALARRAASRTRVRLPVAARASW